MRRDRDVQATEIRVALGGLALAILLVLWQLLPTAADHAAEIARVAAFGYLVATALIAGPVLHHRWYFSSLQKFRRELGPPQGWLDRHDVRDTAGEAAVRRRGATVRPALTDRTHQLTPVTPPVSQFGFLVGQLVSGSRRLRGTRVYSPWSRGFGLVGPQGSGKTQFLVNAILDSPGAVFAPSTKPELATLTAKLRAEVGPVAVFNPSNLGNVPNSFYWDPVAGCTDQAVADARAWALVRGGGGAQGVERPDFWAGKAQEIIRCYLMAAAIKRWHMTEVMYWANNPDDGAPRDILARTEGVPAGWLATLVTHLKASPNTRTGYFATVTSCVGFMDSPTVAAACKPAAGQQFDVETWLRSRGTLYVIGGAGDRRLAPLLTALTEYVFEEAKRIAADSPGEVLDAPLNMLLDEVANITPVPLDRWASDSRGWGITVGPVVQSRAQFDTTWGEHRAEVIWENLPTKIILGGLSNKNDLQALAYLAGVRPMQRTTEGSNDDRSGRRSHSTSRTTTSEPVVEGHTIASLPTWHAYVLGLGRHAAIVRYEPGYQRAARELQQLAERQQQWTPLETGPVRATTEGVRA